MIIQAIKLNKKEVFSIEVNKDNFLQIKYALLKERNGFINKLKDYKNAGLIGSIKYPRNKYMQDELDDIVKKKKILKKSLEQINKLFLS